MTICNVDDPVIAALEEARNVTCPYCATEMPLSTVDPGMHIEFQRDRNRCHACKAIAIRKLITARSGNLPPPGVISLVEAKARRACRICGVDFEHDPSLPQVYSFGREHAHEKCLDAARAGKTEVKP